MAKKRVASSEQGSRAICERIITLRKARSIPKVEVAAKFGGSQPLERNELLLRAELLGYVATALPVSSDDLLGLQKRKPSTALAAPRRQPADERRLWRHPTLVASRPERDQHAVLRVIDAAARAGRSA